MRKKEFVIFVFLVLCIWAMVTYFLFLYRPLSSLRDGKEEELEQRLSKLETSLGEEAAVHDKLMGQLKLILSKKKDLLHKKIIGDNAAENIAANAGGAAEEEEEAEDLAAGAIDSEPVDPQDEMLQEEDDTTLQVPVIAILVISCNRVTVNRCLDGLLRYRPSKKQFPIIVSQDCQHPPTTEVIRSYGDHISFMQQPDQSDISIPPKEKKFKGYFRIARHYGWAINQTFFNLDYETVIIVEDDLEVAPDFFEYFLGTHRLLRTDPSLWCVSAWNDNGKETLVDTTRPELLYRTDFFPGLGWMMTRELWSELSIKWPRSYWDDWIREPSQRKGRACIRPEISRTRTFGKIGVSNGLFYEKHLKYIKLNDKVVEFSKMDLTYLLKDKYDVNFVKKVYESPIVSYEELKTGKIVHDGDVRISYHTKDVYKRTAKMLGLMDDFRSGVPRTGYRGIVTFTYNKRRVYLAPNVNWRGYNTKWS